MSHSVILDPLYPEMEEATIGQWLVAEGDVVSASQPIAELITDKVAYEYQSPIEGIILAILSPAKSVVPIGTVLTVIGVAGEQVAHLAELEAENRRLSTVREASLAAVHEATATQAPAPVVAAVRPGTRATPAARRLARERGVDLATVQGTGPDGMVTVDDIP
jgi:pyruvate dehydrogenase E2 component (dihydrolipoamide acetyltransferase)